MRFTRMTILRVAIAATVGAAGLAGVAHAQSAKATITDPVGPPPDPVISDRPAEGHQGTGQEGRQRGRAVRRPSKPGLYGVVIKWYPGNFSQPHFHDQERYAYVISGTGGCPPATSMTKTTYPVQAGTVAIDKANTVHWDGARQGEKEPAVLVLVGMGPVKTIQVDENGKPSAAGTLRENTDAPTNHEGRTKKNQSLS